MQSNVLRRLLLLAALLAVTLPATAGYTFVGGCGNNSDGSSLTVACTVASVQAGDLAFTSTSFEGATTTATVSDGTSSLTATAYGVTAGTRNSEPWLAAHYLLSSTATGSVTYTTTLGATRTFKQIAVQVWRPSAAASLDGTAVAAASAAGGSTTPNSGNITTTTSDGLAFASYAEFGQATTAELINGVAEDQKQIANAGASRNSSTWSRTFAAGFTGAASGTLASAQRWTIGVTAFKISAAAGTVVNPISGRGGGAAQPTAANDDQYEPGVGYAVAAGF